MKLFIARLVLLILLAVPSFCGAWIHVARDGETLAQLASFYYGSSDKAIVIRAANGFMHPDDGSLLPGERVEIPGIYYHSVEEGEDWYSLANRFLGSSKRASFLAELNRLDVDTTVPPGKIVKVPYQLLYIFAPNESLNSIARLFLGNDFSPSWLREYNLKKRKKYGRGDAILVPLINVDYTETAKKEIEQQQVREVSTEDKNVQVEAAAQIANLREFYAEGRYLLLVATGQRLLAIQQLTNPQLIGVYQYMAFAYVAFDEPELARRAFASALELQPSMELSPITVSPKILKVFQEVQQRLLSQKK